MNNKNDHSYALTRGLGGLFIFASLEFLENDQFLWVVVALAVGIINMLPYLWSKTWSSILLYGLNTAASSVVFYRFIQLDTKYIQWMWLVLMVYYVLRLRSQWKKHRKQQKVEYTDNTLAH